MINCPKHIFAFLLLPSITLMISGCSAFGVPYTSDPYTKIDYGYTLVNQGRALPAEKLAKEALKEFHETGNTRGIAEAHVFLGQFYKSPTYRSYAPFYKKHDEYDPGNGKAISHILRAVELYKELNNYTQVAKAKFALASAYLNNDRLKACEIFDETVMAYKKDKIENPEETFKYNQYYGNFEALVEAFKGKFCSPEALILALKPDEEKVVFDLSSYAWEKTVSIDLSLAENLDTQDCALDQLLNNAFYSQATEYGVNIVETRNKIPHLEVVVKKVKEGMFGTAKAKSWITAKLFLDNQLIGDFDIAENINFYEGYNSACDRIGVSLERSVSPLFIWLQNPTSS